MASAPTLPLTACQIDYQKWTQYYDLYGLHDQDELQKSRLHRVQSPATENKPADSTKRPPGINQIPPSLLPFRGDEPRLIDFYAMPVPDPDTVLRMAKTDAGRIFTFVD